MSMVEELRPESEGQTQEDIRRKIAQMMRQEAPVSAAPSRRRDAAMAAEAPTEPAGIAGAVAQKAAPSKRRLPSAGMIGFGAALLLCVFQPWLVIGLVLLAVWVVLGIYLVFGPERVHRFALRRLDRFRVRNPERAEVLRQRAQSIVRSIEKLVERLPESWRAGLYLPQFDDPAAEPAHEKMRQDPFERLR